MLIRTSQNSGRVVAQDLLVTVPTRYQYSHYGNYRGGGSSGSREELGGSGHLASQLKVVVRSSTGSTRPGNNAARRMGIRSRTLHHTSLGQCGIQ